MFQLSGKTNFYQMHKGAFFSLGEINTLEHRVGYQLSLKDHFDFAWQQKSVTPEALKIWRSF